MGTKAERVKKVLKITFGLILVAIVAFLIAGEIVAPAEDPTEAGEAVLFEADWERVYADGSREAIEVPGQYKSGRGEIFRMETVLPDCEEDTWMCMRASQQDMRVYVGDELRKEYTTKESRIFGKNSASVFVFFEISEKDAGKVLAIETISDSNLSGFLNEVYIGDKADIISTFVRQCYLVLLVSVYMLILSSITVLVGAILRFVYKIKMEITYLGLGILQLSLAMITESRLRQFFLPNSSVAAHVGFLLTMLIPYPFMVYVSRIQKGRYEKAYRILSLVVVTNFIVSILLQMFNIADFADSSISSYGLIVVMVILMAITIILDIKRGKIREYKELVIGILVMLAVSLWETYLTFVPIAPYVGGVALSFGLIILLFMAGFKTARDMISIEKEKQAAIIAGESKAKFLANMSHEIRTPINTIIGMNEMILRENKDESVDEYAKNVQNASQLLLGLINDILDFSKIEAGKMDIVESDYYVSKMLTSVIKGTEIKAADKKLAVKTEIDETLPSILKGDEIRIRQVLNNLLSNAVKYTQHGTITFKIKGMQSGDSGFALHMSVEDTGIGIKKEDLEKLFDSFKRLEEDRNRYIEGTGLGLNITKQLVELMGGTIEVRSEYGKGSCFTVIIPQQIVNELPMGGIEEAYKRDSDSKVEVKKKLYAPSARILVVDDNKMNLAVVKGLLKRTGIRLTMAEGGQECLDLCTKNKFDLILMDHMMPAPDGIETLHMLKADKVGLNYGTEVIVLTANAIAGMAEMYMAEGFADYLSKPIVAEDLEEMIRRHLSADKLEVEGAIGEKKEDKGELPKTGQAASEVVAEDVLHINKMLAMEYCGNMEDLYKEVIETYIVQGAEHLRKLKEYYEECDWENYRIIAHSLKSTSKVIGAMTFAERAKYIESVAAEQNEELLQAEGKRFIEEYEAILKKLE